MNREEAISNLASAMDLINGLYHALWESIDALVTDASPDPITGLVPCEYCVDTYDQRKLYCANNYEPRTCMESTIIITAGADERKHQIEVDLWDGVNAFAAFDINYCPMCGRKLSHPPLSGSIGPDAGEIG